MNLGLLQRLIVIALGYKLQVPANNSSSAPERLSLAHPILVSRLNKTSEVLRRNKEERVVLFSGNGCTNGSTEAAVMRDMLTKAHGNCSVVHIKLEEISSNTVENAICVRRMLLAEEIDTANETLHIVTSRFHMTRVKLIFDHVFNQQTLQYHSADDAADDMTIAELLHKEAASTRNLNHYLHTNWERFQLRNISDEAIAKAHNDITLLRYNYLHL